MDNRIRDHFWQTLNRSGITAAFRSLTPGLRILTYHSFSLHPWTGVTDSQKVSCLRAQLTFVAQHFDVVSLADGLRRLSDSDQRGRPRLAITVDDGFADNYDLLYPVLRQLSLPATVFLSTDFLDNHRLIWPVRILEILLSTRRCSITSPIRSSLTSLASRTSLAQALKAYLAPLDPESRFAVLRRLARDLGVEEQTKLTPLAWAQVREMASDLVEFGSHTVYHGFLPLLTPSAAREELETSKRRIEYETGRECRFFAYPNGDYDMASAQLVAAARYQAGLTQRLGTNGPSTPRYALARVHVPPDYPVRAFAFRVSTPQITALLVRGLTFSRAVRSRFFS